VADFTCEPTTGSVSGRVTRSDTTEPLQGVTVSADSRTAVTNAAGEYRIDGLSPGATTVAVTAGLPAGVLCEPAEHDVVIAAGTVQTADFACAAQQVGSVTGQLLMGALPVGGAVLRLADRTTTTDALGFFAFTNILYGAYLLEVLSHPSWLTCPATPVLLAEALLSLTIGCVAIAFTISASPSWRHFTNFSELCLAVAATVLLAGAPFQADVSGPGLEGPSTFQGVLNAQGEAVLRATITAYGIYTWIVRILGQTATASSNVGSEPGGC
jgi:hypothetical protein